MSSRVFTLAPCSSRYITSRFKFPLYNARYLQQGLVVACCRRIRVSSLRSQAVLRSSRRSSEVLDNRGAGTFPSKRNVKQYMGGQAVTARVSPSPRGSLVGFRILFHPSSIPQKTKNLACLIHVASTTTTRNPSVYGVVHRDNSSLLYL
jgi:hypothetical protein